MSDEKKQEIEKLYDKSFEVTFRVMAKVRERTSKITLYLFNPCGPVTEMERKICDALNFECIEGVYEHASEIEKAGHELRVVNNGHWNKEGNQVIGEWLIRYFRDRNIF